MDSLDEKFSKLDLMSGRSHSPHLYASSETFVGDSNVISGGKVAALANSFEQHPSILLPTGAQVMVGNNGQSKKISGSNSPKKVGPIVPPKPQKQVKFPEVPQSIVVKQAREPLYSKRLQSTRVRVSTSDEHQIDSNPKIDSALVSRPPILHRNQGSIPVEHLYSKLNKVTLDNPAVLQQQLEALAHHKLQLEKKGLLHQQELKSGTNFGSTFKNVCIPKLSSSSLATDLNHSGSISSLKPGAPAYSNISAPLREQTIKRNADTDSASLNVYSNVTLADQFHFNNKQELSSSGVYPNTHYDNDSCLEDLPPPPPPAVLTISTHQPSQFMKEQSDDANLPPPSPVSSSYSELRHATDIFSKIPAPAPIQQIHSVGGQVGVMQYPPYIKNCADGKSVAGGNFMGNQQTYMNMNFNNDYTSFTNSTSSQSINQGSSDYYGYGSFSQESSTYESIYEPINPRPPSELSGRSNYLMYVNGPQATDGAIGSNGCLSYLTGASNSDNMNLTHSSDNGLYDNHRNPKEAEVEALTDFLVQSMDAANDADSYGACVKCKERVVGENSGCTAMDQVYHIACFTCSQCQINLQGKPFYALDCKPYCEYDYLQTLEKCSVCMKPILERILRATGKPYHPQCFTCVECGNSLDGIPFTVDATNQNYCIADFHKKFAPRCCVCKQPIMPEAGQEETVRVVALDRSFHFECYKCEDCGLLLSSEAEGRGCYPLDDHVLCKSCNAKRVQMLTNRMTTEL